MFRIFLSLLLFFSLSITVSAGGSSLTWDAVATDISGQKTTIISYTVYCAPGRSAFASPSMSTTATNIDLSGILTSVGAYRCAVSASNSSGESLLSEPVSFFWSQA